MVTLKQIADAVGVSTATVSRVLNFDSALSVTEAKRKAIIETAEALNYATPRARNRARQHGLHKVALVHFLRPHQELIDPYYVGLRLGIESRCQALQCETVKVYRTERMPEPTLLQGADGVIAIGLHSEAEVEWLRRYSRRLVFADFIPNSDAFDAVESDLSLATRKLLEGLTEMGYRRIGFAGWTEDGNSDPYAEIRCRSYIAWTKARGMFDPRICLTQRSVERNTEQTGYQLAAQLLAERQPPDAILACNDNIAIGVYRAAREIGLHIPEDVAVASFNDIPAAQFLNPPLTTVHLPAEEIGEAAVDLLLQRVAGRTVAQRIIMASEIRWRGSTRNHRDLMSPDDNLLNLAAPELPG
jgi:LacI family transcriptional regulator